MRIAFLLCIMLVGDVPAFCGEKAPKNSPPEVTLDTSDAPETAERAKKAADLSVKWHPIVAKLLPSEGYTPPTEVRIRFKKDMKGVAYTTGNTITIAAKWIKDNPRDYGMVVHELAHVIQGYRKGGPSWLVEGIADYVRFAHFEPETRIDINPKRTATAIGRPRSSWPGSKRRTTRTSCVN